jgi:hypothetical protein
MPVGRIVIWIAAVLLAGCTSYGTQVTEAQAAQFENGKSTQGEIVAKLGPPSAYSERSADGTHSLSYRFSHLQMSAASYLPVVGALAGETQASLTVVTFTFDVGDRLVDRATTHKDIGEKTGLLNR